MKKILLSLSSALLLTNALQAQITISQSSFTNTYVGTTDSVLGSGSTSTYPSLSPATNGVWDLSASVSLTNLSLRKHVAPFTATYTNATYADSLLFKFSNFSYLAFVQNELSANGLLELGEHINRQAVSPGTSNSADSIVFDQQNIVYSSPDTLLSFPATYNRNWTSIYHYDFNFHLSVSQLLLNNAPGFVRAYITKTDSVVGYGTMKVLRLDGTTSSPVNVLQIHTTQSTMDSFFISGSPANAFVLAAFQVTQGQTTTSYNQNFYEVNEVTPLATVTYSDAAYTTASAAHTRGHGPYTTAVQNIALNNNISIFPNPLAGQTLNVKITNASTGNYSYNMVDMNGRSVCNGNLQINDQQATIAVPAMLARGIYFIQINLNGQQLMVQPLDIAK